MSYTSTTKVRELSGFQDENNISDNVIKGKISVAESMVDSASEMRYILPFVYRSQNNITFEGTATSNGTIEITINSVLYTINVTSGDTASQIADSFRTEIQSVTDIHEDSIGNGNTSRIISNSTSSDLATAILEVTATLGTITAGDVSVSVEGVRDRYVPMIDQITAEIAASLVLMDNFGIEAQDTPKDGEARMNRINDTLQKIQGVSESKQIIKYFDEITKEELQVSARANPGFLPNATTDDDPTNPTSPKISINTEF
jgi:hypothetical protein